MSRAAIYARLSLADEKSTSTRRQECSDPEHQATAATPTLATSDELIVTEFTLAECAHVRRTVYHTPDNVIAAVLRSLIAQPNISVEHPERATTTLNCSKRPGLATPMPT